MDTSNCQTTIPKDQPPKQTVFCPWVSRAPLASSAAVRQCLKSSEQQTIRGSVPQNLPNCQQTTINQPRCNNEQMSPIGLPNGTNLSPSLNYPSIQQSSSQFFHFLRLMQLFPDVHPATLHTVLVLCKSDFFCAVDKLLYAKRCKQMYNTRRNYKLEKFNSPSKVNRQKPYCCMRPTTIVSNCTSNSEEAVQNSQLQVPLGLQSFTQVLPLDVSVKKMQASDDSVTASEGKSGQSASRRKSADTKKILGRNRAKTKDKRLSLSSSAIDLPPVVSPQCNLPILALSPITTVIPEDLSTQFAPT